MVAEQLQGPHHAVTHKQRHHDDAIGIHGVEQGVGLRLAVARQQQGAAQLGGPVIEHAGAGKVLGPGIGKITRGAQVHALAVLLPEVEGGAGKADHLGGHVADQVEGGVELHFEHGKHAHAQQHVDLAAAAHDGSLIQLGDHLDGETLQRLGFRVGRGKHHRAVGLPTTKRVGCTEPVRRCPRARLGRVIQWPGIFNTPLLISIIRLRIGMLRTTLERLELSGISLRQVKTQEAGAQFPEPAEGRNRNGSVSRGRTEKSCIEMI